MHLMRGGDEEATRVFAEFGNTKGNSGQRIFVKQVRKFLSERAQDGHGNNGEEEQRQEKMQSLENTDSPAEKSTSIADIISVNDKRNSVQNGNKMNVASSVKVQTFDKTTDRAATEPKNKCKDIGKLAENQVDLSNKMDEEEENSFAHIMAKL